ncbi:MAG: 2-amino-4-hydroxy-6-hydroxymethyldihydropteridine diphosphokinase [Alteromonadaceae bacterium]|nr:2-amino-4-hydroxy-6-hydroxymethyldihydropteridine diphosphokinase [Alteromonadaceae bacterium]
MAEIYISLGTNINRAFHVQQGLDALSHHFGELKLSSLFESDSIGFEGTAFYNLVVGLSTDLSVAEVVKILREIEIANGRSLASKKFSPRTLDLDLLLYDDLVLESPAQIPRDEITTNAFVLWPLSQIVPKLKHPILHQNYESLWEEYDQTSQQLKIMPLNWNSKSEPY